MTTENEQQADRGSQGAGGGPSGSTGSGGTGKLFLIVLLLLGGSIAFQKFCPLAGGGGASGPSMPLPPLMVEGWLNTSSDGVPSNESLAGKLVVIDAWATWCGPCRSAMPGLAEVHDRWADQGVAFLGMTSESGDKIEAIQSFADSVPGFDWPIGYGARGVWDALGIESIPTLILFGTDGVSVWQGHSIGALEAEIKKRVL